MNPGHFQVVNYTKLVRFLKMLGLTMTVWVNWARNYIFYFKFSPEIRGNKKDQFCKLGSIVFTDKI